MANPIRSFVDLTKWIAKLRVRDQEGAQGVSDIQDSINQMSQRLAAVEVPEIQDAVYPSAGAAAGYIQVTVGNKQYKVAISELK